VTLYVWVSEPTQFTTGSTRVSRVLDGLDQKSTCIKVCKRISTQPEILVGRVGSKVPTNFDNSN